MGQKKLIRFQQFSTLSNIYEKPDNMQGEWAAHFQNDHPVILELACGRGEYTVALAQMHPGKNFIGVDIKGNRMFLGAKKAIDQQLSNAAFLRTEIEKIDQYFAAGEVSEIWITFPDPQLRISKAKKRLTHPRFLRQYFSILKPGAPIHLKTDSPRLYRFTRMVIERYKLQLHEFCENVVKENNAPELKIRTHYEALDIAGSNKIFYLRFSIPHALVHDDAALQILLQETENPETT